SSLFLYPIGYVIAAIFSAFIFSPTLHYIPSPSICQYLFLRFHLNILRLGVVLIHILLISSLSIMLLVYSTSFIAQISKLSPFIICPLITYFGIFSVIYGGQTTIAAPTFFIPFVVSFNSFFFLCRIHLQSFYNI
uniref:Product n=1 Tax=Ascaris lumbricoides TaxID=6252 RepID=A0A0M3IWP1_ASCLU